MEIIKSEVMSDSLVRIKWLTKHKDEVPLFWNALFYQRSGQWEPLSIFFFDDPIKAEL